ncbi:ribonuclease H-like protein [Suillus subaureus]|uniref:ribonuclease H n=1 Tax=Suillus subaureus TaxID=48587 RepID=A0A9P7EG51_9AGAM|nr:ribonuclease H-like protein [Suillus subaureus]KAG1820375.1 ribonuclease H-like protein [Suillus subaureus]
MRSQQDGEILFDPTVTAKTHISECFCIFVNTECLVQIPAYRLHAPGAGRGKETEPITIYTNGSCKNNGKYNATCSSGIWIGEDHPMNRAIRIPRVKQSNQIGELAVVLVALQSTNPLTPVKIVMDSKYVIKGVTTHLKEWEDTGWIGVNNTNMFKAIAYHLCRHPTPTTFKWVKGHQGNIGNEKADQLALTGTLCQEPDKLDTYVPRNFNLQGAKLLMITQKLAYKVIANTANLEYKKTTLSLLDLTRYAIESLTSSLKTDATIWKGCRHKDITKKIQMFLYKTLNNAYHISDFWSQIPTYEHRAICQMCQGETDSMEHILINCRDPVRKMIWDLAKKLWPDRHRPWPTPHIGLILGCGVITLPQRLNNNNANNNRTPTGASHLLRILISESAHLIRTMRCDRTINSTTYTELTATNCWYNTINKRLHLDRAIANKEKRNTKTAMTVKNTWSNIIDNNTLYTQDDWMTNLEVLVGIGLPRPSQTVVTR